MGQLGSTSPCPALSYKGLIKLWIMLRKQWRVLTPSILVASLARWRWCRTLRDGTRWWWSGRQIDQSALIKIGFKLSSSPLPVLCQQVLNITICQCCTETRKSSWEYRPRRGLSARGRGGRYPCPVQGHSRYHSQVCSWGRRLNLAEAEQQMSSLLATGLTGVPGNPSERTRDHRPWGTPLPFLLTHTCENITPPSYFVRER